MDIRIGDHVKVKEDAKAGIIAHRAVVIAINCENGEGIPTEIVVSDNADPTRINIPRGEREINRVAPDQIETIDGISPILLLSSPEPEDLGMSCPGDDGDYPVEDYPVDYDERDRMAAESERLADHPFSGSHGEY